MLRVSILAAHPNFKTKDMDRETLEKAQAALANLEAHQRLLEKLSNASAIAIGVANEVTANSTYMIGSSSPIHHSFEKGIVIGLKSDFLANQKIREACFLFKQEMVHILEEEVARLQSKFENL